MRGTRLLLAALLALAAGALFAPVTASAKQKDPAADRDARAARKAQALTLTVSFLESASRIKLGAATISLALDGKAQKHPLSIGGSVEGITLRTIARPVTVESKGTSTARGVWFELTALDGSGREVAYLAVTLPETPAPGASVATKLAGRAPGEEISLVVTRD